MTTTISGTTGVSRVQPGAVDAQALAAGAVGTDKLAVGAVTPVKTSGMLVLQGNQTPLPAAATLLSFAHGFGALPSRAEIELVCLVADQGYSVGDVTGTFTSGSPSYAHPICVTRTPTVVEARLGSNSPWYLVHKTSGLTVAPTAASWAWRFRVWA